MPEELTSTVELQRPSVESSAVPLENATPRRFARTHRHLPMPGIAHVRLPLHLRVRHGVRKPHNWMQLVRFATVGATGYVVNLAVFAVCLHLIGIDYRLSAVAAWLVSVINNFWWNRHWTFGASEAHPFQQGVRFFAVSLLAFGFTYAVLVALVSGVALTKVIAEAIAIAAGTPLNFVGQKLWSFKA